MAYTHPRTPPNSPLPTTSPRTHGITHVVAIHENARTLPSHSVSTEDTSRRGLGRGLAKDYDTNIIEH